MEDEEEGEAFHDTYINLEGREEEIEISIHELCGNTSSHIIRIQGKVKGIPITILINSGSIHNFVDPTIINQSGEVMYQTKQMSITAADGKKLISDAICPKLKWTMQGIPFKADLKVLGIVGCDMVLGID